MFQWVRERERGFSLALLRLKVSSKIEKKVEGKVGIGVRVGITK